MQTQHTLCVSFYGLHTMPRSDAGRYALYSGDAGDCYSFFALLLFFFLSQVALLDINSSRAISPFNMQTGYTPSGGWVACLPYWAAGSVSASTLLSCSCEQSPPRRVCVVNHRLIVSSSSVCVWSQLVSGQTVTGTLYSLL